MDEVDAQPVDPRAVVGKAVEDPLLRRPVELVAPVGTEVAEVVKVGPVFPAGAFEGVREPRSLEALAQVVERRLRNPNLERLHSIGHRLLLSQGERPMRASRGVSRQEARFTPVDPSCRYNRPTPGRRQGEGTWERAP